MTRVLPLVPTMAAMAIMSAMAAVIAVSRCGGSTPSSPSPGPGPSGPPAVLAGAGDIGLCGSPAAAATAQLLDRIPGIVFTAGDNAYPNGTAADFRDCYYPHWGRHRERTRPAPGNHDYESPGATPYFAYFGDNAGPAGLGPNHAYGALPPPTSAVSGGPARRAASGPRGLPRVPVQPRVSGAVGGVRS